MKNKDLESTIYFWFDMKLSTYDKLETDRTIYLYYEDEEYADIAIYKKYKNIYFDWVLWKEFSEIFPIELNEFKPFISKWVGNTFNLKGFTPGVRYSHHSQWLKIPK